MKIEGGVASFNQSKFKTLDHFYIFLPTDFPPHLCQVSLRRVSMTQEVYSM